jgi:hypothetical protein
VDATITVDYAASRACPTDAEFWDAFVSRAQHVTRSDRGDFVLVVRIEKSASRFHGSLRVVRRSETMIERTLDDVSCADIATALAIVAAITVESAPLPPSPPPPPPPPPLMPPPPPPPAARDGWSLRAGADTVVTSFLSPTSSFGGAAWVEIEQQEARFVGFRARVGAHAATSFAIEVTGGSVLVTSVLGRIELGGPRLRLARMFGVRLGAFGELGTLVTEGRAVGGRTVSVFFADLGAMLRAAWEPASFFVEAGLGGVFSLARPSFRFQYETTGSSLVVFEVPVGGFVGEVGLGVRLF